MDQSAACKFLVFMQRLIVPHQKSSQATNQNECVAFDSLLRVLQPYQLYFLFSGGTTRNKAFYTVAIQHFSWYTQIMLFTTFYYVYITD